MATFDDQIFILEKRKEQAQSDVIKGNVEISEGQEKMDEIKAFVARREAFIAETDAAIRLLQGAFDK